MARPKEQFNALAIFLDAKDQQLQDQIKEKLMEKEKSQRKKELRQAFEQLDDKYKKTDYFVEAIEIPTFSGKQAELEKNSRSNLSESIL